VQESAENFVGGARIDVVGTQQEEAFRPAAVFAQQVFHRRNRLLVWRRAGVEDVRRHLFAFVLYRIEEQTVQLFEYRQNRFTRYGGPATEHRRHLILGQQLPRFFGE